MATAGEEIVEKLVKKIEELGHVPMPGGYPYQSGWTMQCESFRKAPGGAARSLVCLALLGMPEAMRRKGETRDRWWRQANAWLTEYAKDIRGSERFAVLRRSLLDAMLKAFTKSLPKGGNANAIAFRTQVAGWRDRAGRIVGEE